MLSLFKNSAWMVLITLLAKGFIVIDIALIPDNIHAQAQRNFEEQLAHAELLYNTGRFDEAIKKITECLGNDSISEQEKMRAYRLLGLSYIGKDYLEEAKAAVKKLLDLVPNYKSDPVQDPPPFIQLIEDVRQAQIGKSVKDPSLTIINNSLVGKILKVKDDLILIDVGSDSGLTIGDVCEIYAYDSVQKIVQRRGSGKVKQTDMNKAVMTVEKSYFTNGNSSIDYYTILNQTIGIIWHVDAEKIIIQVEIDVNIKPGDLCRLTTKTGENYDFIIIGNTRSSGKNYIKLYIGSIGGMKLGQEYMIALVRIDTFDKSQETGIIWKVEAEKTIIKVTTDIMIKPGDLCKMYTRSGEEYEFTVLGNTRSERNNYILIDTGQQSDFKMGQEYLVSFVRSETAQKNETNGNIKIGDLCIFPGKVSENK